MNKQIALDPFQNVVGSGIAICDLNKLLGTVLEKITLNMGGTFTRAMMTKLELKANGKTVWESDGTKTDAVSTYHRNATEVNFVKIDFMDRLARTVNAYQAGALDLSAKSGITSLRLEVTIAGATNPSMAGFADVSPPNDDPAEAGIRWLSARRTRATVVIGAAGEFALPVPHLDPAGGGSNYRKIFLFSANCTRIKTMREGVTEHDLNKGQLENSARDNGRFPQANLVVFDPTQDGQLQGRTWDTRPSSGVRSAQFYATFSAGETITIETEELLPLAAY